MYPTDIYKTIPRLAESNPEFRTEDGARAPGVRAQGGREVFQKKKNPVRTRIEGIVGGAGRLGATRGISWEMEAISK